MYERFGFLSGTRELMKYFSLRNSNMARNSRSWLKNKTMRRL